MRRACRKPQAHTIKQAEFELAFLSVLIILGATGNMSETVAYGGQQLMIGAFHSQHDLIAKAGDL